MTKSAHTKGPWYAMTAETGSMVTDQANVFSQHEIKGEPTFIADTLGVDDDVPLKQRKANAHLISAAPELLELARQLERTVKYEIDKSKKRGDDEEGVRLMTATLNLTRAAIAKAEGRA